MSPIEINRVPPTDLNTIEKVASIAREIWIDHYVPIVGLEQIEYMLEKFQSPNVMREQMELQRFIYFTLEYGQSLCGYIGVQANYADQELFLSKLYVHKEYRGKGIFKAIMNEIYSTAKKLNLNKLRLTVNKYNENSIAVYKHYGFDITEEKVFDIGEGFVMDDYVMEKELNELTFH